MNSTPCCLVAAHNVEQRMRTVREIYFIKNYEFTLWKKQEENKNKLVEKVQKINEDSVDRISRMIFNCDLCLNIMIFFFYGRNKRKKNQTCWKGAKNWWKLRWPDFTHSVQLWSLFMFKHDLWSFGLYFYQGQVLCSSVSINYFVVGLG